MPMYRFQTEDGEIKDMFIDYPEYKRRVYEKPNEIGQFIEHKGQTLKRVYTPPGGHQSSTWPKKSLAAGVNPDQIREQEQYDRKAGLNTKYDPRTGDAIFRDMNHQRKHLKHHGLVERDSFI